MVEHRFFCHMTQNWRGRPLVSFEAVVNLIAHTHTRTGLKVRATLDPGTYPTGVKVTKEQLARVHMEPSDFHGNWNYTFLPTTVST